MLATLGLIATVAQDQIPLRAAARESALQQTVLWQGDTLEVRSEQLDYLEVYDHRRERAGYVRTGRYALIRSIPPVRPNSWLSCGFCVTVQAWKRLASAMWRSSSKPHR